MEQPGHLGCQLAYLRFFGHMMLFYPTAAPLDLGVFSLNLWKITPNTNLANLSSRFGIKIHFPLSCCCCSFVVSTLSLSCLWEICTGCGWVSRMTRIHQAKPDQPFFSKALCCYSQIYCIWNSLKAWSISQTDPPYCSEKCCKSSMERNVICLDLSFC